jgi:hypothetical protein
MSTTTLSVVCVCNHCAKGGLAFRDILDANAEIAHAAIIAPNGLDHVRKHVAYFERWGAEFFEDCCASCVRDALWNAIDATLEGAMMASPEFLAEEFREGV